MRWLLVFGLVTALFPVASEAQQCVRPYAPLCVKSFGPFDDDLEADSCRAEMVDYVNQMEDLITCLNQVGTTQASRVALDAQYEAEDMIRHYHCRSEGDTC
ncbi:MAG: hypothetical protein AAGA88_02450 [Pseudomonadota bacterium]